MTYQRDLKKLIVSLDSLTNGQASVKVDDENVCKFTLTIVPNDGPYRNGKFDFEISFDDPSSYPADLPEVLCTTPIYHPNIDNDQNDANGTNVCLSLFDEWDSNSLADVVQGLLFLFYNPNIEDPLSSLFDGSETQDEFTERVRMSLMGELEIDGVVFTRNQVTDNNHPPASSDAINSDAPCDTSDLQEETNDTSCMNTNDNCVLEANSEISSNDDDIITQKTSDDSSVHLSHDTAKSEESNDRVSNVTNKGTDHELATSERDLVKRLEKQDSICTAISSDPSTPAVVICPTLNQANHQTWNMVLGTVTTLLYVGFVFVNCDQHFYEVLR